MMTMRTQLRRWVRVALVGVCLWATPVAGALVSAQPPPSTAKPPAATDEFVPISEIPEHDKLPAAPFLIAAYVVAWLAVLIYVWSLWKRLSKVEDELKRLKAS